MDTNLDELTGIENPFEAFTFLKRCSPLPEGKNQGGDGDLVEVMRVWDSCGVGYGGRLLWNYMTLGGQRPLPGLSIQG